MKTFIVPSDFSKNATTALLYDIRLSNLMQAKLVVFHCYQVSFSVITEATSEEQTDLLIKKDIGVALQKLQTQVINAYKELGINTVPSTTSVGVELNPLVVEKTIDIARKHQADLIVMGTHGASGLNPFTGKELRVVQLMEKNAYGKIRLVKQKAVIEQTLLKQLRKYLDEQKPQWLVMFTKERSFWNKILLRSKTEDIANFTLLPLLSFKKRLTEYPLKK